MPELEPHHGTPAEPLANDANTVEPGAKGGEVKAADPGGGVDADSIHAERDAITAHSIGKIDQRNIEQWLNLDPEAVAALVRPPLKFRSFTHEEVRQEVQRVVFDPAEVEGVVSRLEATRLLVVRGPAGVGKTRLALVAARELCERHELAKVFQARAAPQKEQKVDLFALTGEDSELGESVVVVGDAFRQGNRSLLRLLSRSDELTRDKLREQLSKRRVYLVLTCDDPHRPKLGTAFEGQVMAVRGPAQERIIEHLSGLARERIKGLEQDDKDALLQRFEKLIAERGTQIADRLGIRRIKTFVAHHLLLVLEQNDEGAALESALAQADSLDRWLLDELADDPEALAFTLALTLAHGGPKGFPIRWFTFERLRCGVLEALREAADFESEEADKRMRVATARALCREPELLDQIGAEVEEDKHGPLIRFADEARAERLWACLLGAGRSLAVLLLPKLAELCLEEGSAVRRHAAWAIARIGRLDPSSILIPHLGRWLRVERFDAPLAAGSLLQGAVFSGSDELRRLAFARLARELRAPGSGATKIRAVFALGEVALVDLDWALGELRKVARRDLRARLLELQDADRWRRLFEVEAGRRIRGSQARRNLAKLFEKEMARVLAELFPEEGRYRLLAAVQYVLIGLVFDRGALPVLRELGKWMPPGREAEELGSLLALVFFRVNGALDVLERYPIASTTDSKKASSRLLLSASEEDGGPRGLADVLFRLYLGVRWFPPSIARGLSFRLWAWVEGVTKKESRGELRGTLVDLWWALLKIPQRDFRDRLGDLLDRLAEDGKPSVRALVRELRGEDRERLTAATNRSA